MRGARAIASTAAVVAFVFAAGAVFYFTQKTSFLASGRPIHHASRGVVLAVLAVLALVVAYMARSKQPRG